MSRLTDMDRAFVYAFEHGTLAAFQHRDHLHLAWCYLADHGWEQGLAQIRQGIQQFALAHGAATKYHETITVFWARLVHIAMLHEADFETLLVNHPELLDKSLIQRHYSAARLFSEEARQKWIEPDLLPLPVAG